MPSSAKVEWLQISGSRNDDASVTFPAQDFQVGGPISITGLSVGTWTFKVVGYSVDPSLEGSLPLTMEATNGNVVIQSGKTTNASFVLHYLDSGTGGYSITVNWPQSLAPFSKVEAVVGTTEVEGTINGSSALIEGRTDVGDYPVEVVFTNPLGSQISFPYMEMVNVYHGLESTGSISFEEADFNQVQTPTMTTADATGGQQVSIGCGTSEASIYYTTDGSDPGASGTTTHYENPFSVVRSSTIRAVAVREGYLNSAEESQEVVVSQVEAPLISSTPVTDGQQISISSGTNGATIYYTTDGREPTDASSTYSGGFLITETTTIKAIAVKAGMIDSAIACEEYTLQSGYKVGDTGPAGGTIFYVDTDDSFRNWTYLEAAPTDEPGSYVYGGWETEIGISAQGLAIGTGETNTNAIVNKFGATEPYEGKVYAAKVCYDKVVTYNGNKYSDWFLPSFDELYLMYQNKDAINGFSDIWYLSSSENTAKYVVAVHFTSGNRNFQYLKTYYDEHRIRAIRSF